MSENFDPYFEWFDIAIEERPINYYRLLDLNRFESKPEVISAALENQINKVTEFLDGEHHAEAQRILEEIRIAGKVLLDEEAKLKYDIGLDPKRAPKPKPVLDPNARLQPKPKPEPEPEPEEEPESEPESAPSLKEEEKPEIKSESEPEPAPAPKEEEKPEKKDAPKPPLPSLTKRPPQPKPPILTKLPPGAKDPAAHNTPKSSVTPPPAPVQPPTPPRVILKPVPVAVPASTASESALQENLGFIKEELDTKPEFDFDAIIAKKDRTIFILGLACGFLLVMVSVLAIALVSQTGKKPAQIAQAVSEQEVVEEETSAEQDDKDVKETEEIEEEEYTEEEDDDIDQTDDFPGNKAPRVHPPQPQPQVFEEAEDEALTVEEGTKTEENNTAIGFQPDQKENPDLNRNNPPRVPSVKGSRKAGTRHTLNIDGVEYAFRWCPPGEFIMGDIERKDDPNNLDIPHRVVLTQGFWILETEVTQEMWVSIMGENPSAFCLGGREAGAVPNMDTSLFPVEQVNWKKCQEFCQKLSQKIGVTAKLPTEAQWEYACRAGTTTPYNTGTKLTQEQGNFKDYDTINPIDRTCACRSYPPNAWGIYDMHGNVSEWCEDWYKQGYYHISPLEDPKGPDAGREKAYRGGNWASGSWACRSANRLFVAEWGIFDNTGFRFILVDGPQTGSIQNVEEERTKAAVDNHTLTVTSKKSGTTVKQTPENDVPETNINLQLEQSKFKAGEQTVHKIDGIEYRFRWCPPGTYMMGIGINGRVQLGPNRYMISPKISSLDDLHPITLSKGFWMLETEVTQEMWLKVMGKNPSRFSETGYGSKELDSQNTNQFPVESVSWEECQQFCAEISRKTGLNAKLPTEAQWEYACRAGTTTPYNTGSELTADLANINSSKVVAPLERPVPCGSYPPNAWGLYDMHGNVAEWCQDQYLQGYYKLSPKVDPQGPEKGKGHIYRGGSFMSKELSGARNFSFHGDGFIGFRFILVDDSQADVVQQAEKDAPEEVTEKPVLVTTPKKPDTKVKSTPEKNVPEMKINPKLKKKKNKTGEQAILKIDGIEYRFRWCPPGTFMMGEGINGKIQTGPNTFITLAGSHKLDDLHQITLTKGFWILETEVTQEMWVNVMGKNPSSFSQTGSNAERVHGQNTAPLPVESVTWDDCQQFCTAFSQKTGLNVKLPTEAQWEYACRAGTSTPYNTGTNISVQLANIADPEVVAPLERPVRCGCYPPNAWGIYDMHGNVAEWCQDFYVQGYYKISPKVDPLGPENGKNHIYRGGSWWDRYFSCRSGSRNHDLPFSDFIGFRFIIIQE